MMGRRDFRTKREAPMAQSGEPPIYVTAADVLARVGVSPKRIRMNPPPGTATERDLIQILRKTDHLYELVDGVLVEKSMGFTEDQVAQRLGYLFQDYLQSHDLGLVVGAGGGIRLMPRLVRLPDLLFVRWEQLPGRKTPRDPFPDLAPDLAVEVLSEGNTKKERERKLSDYFFNGVRLVWFIDPPKRTVTVYTAPDQPHLLSEDQTLDGGDVLPGLAIPLRKIFVHVPEPEEPPKRKKGKRRKPGKS